MTFNDLQIGQKASVQKTFTAADVTAFAGISLDVNPIHMSDKYAESTIFGKRIVDAARDRIETRVEAHHRDPRDLR